MTSQGTVNDGPHAFTILDSDIPFLAIKAAIELDNLRLGIPSELAAVRSLATRLQSSTTQSGPPETIVSLVFDPPTYAAIRDAIAVTSHTSPATIEELAAEAWEIATSLRNASTDPANELQTLSRFCAVLSERATACQIATGSTDIIDPIEAL